MAEKLPYDEEIVGADEYIPPYIAESLRQAEQDRPSRSLKLLGALALGATSMAAGVVVSRYRITHA